MAWDWVKSVVAVLMVVLLLEDLNGFYKEIYSYTSASTLKSMQSGSEVYLLAPLSAMQSYEVHGSIISFYLYTLGFPCHILLKVLFSYLMF